VLLFIQSNPHCHGIKRDTTLYNKASKKYCIVTPATLLATLRTIDSMWANQNSRKMLLKLQDKRALYDKFEGFVTDLIKIGKKVKSKTEYSWL
jgi:DNA recombination protein RmuC